MERLSDWEARLSEYLQERREMPFKYGSNDCAHFAAGAVKAVTGEDVMSDIKSYTTKAGSLRAIKEAGADSLEQIIDRKFEALPIGFASTGDLALYDGSVGVVLSGKAAFVSEDGFALVPRDQWTQAWGVARG